MLFKEIIGLEKIKEQLMLSHQKNRVAHSQLFKGPKGSGKLALALAYARFLNCKNTQDMDSCNSCDSCIQFSKLSHPDLHIIFPVVKTTSNKFPQSSEYVEIWKKEFLKNPYFSLSNWSNTFRSEFLEKVSDKKKELAIYSHQITDINRKLSLKIFSAKYRVIIIWMPEKMNLQASNKFLKILEEPPKKTVLIFVAQDSSNLLKTILSRLQATNIKPYTIQQTINIRNGEKTEEFLKFCRISSGDMGAVLNYNIDTIQDNDTENFIELMRISFKSNFSKISNWSDEISAKTRQDQVRFLTYCLDLIRECIIYNYSNHDLASTTNKEQEFLKNFAKFIHEQNSLLIIDLFEEAVKNIKRNANAKIIFFNLSLELVKLLKLKVKFAEN